MRVCVRLCVSGHVCYAGRVCGLHGRMSVPGKAMTDKPIISQLPGYLPEW